MQYLQIDFLNIWVKNSKKQNCGKIQNSKQIKMIHILQGSVNILVGVTEFEVHETGFVEKS